MSVNIASFLCRETAWKSPFVEIPGELLEIDLDLKDRLNQF